MTIKEFYAAINGNYEDALKRMMYDMLISKMLKKFSEGSYLTMINEGIQEKDIKKVFAGAHTLKGVAGNLSFTTLFDLASELCEKTRGKDEYNNEIETDFVALKKEYNKTIQLINEIQ